MNLEWKITPMGAPRANRSDAWRKRPVILKYYKFRDDVNSEMKKIEFPWKSLETLIVDFFIPMPKSWSAKKVLAMNNTPHQQKPDIDNLTKALLDSIFRDGDDCRVYDIKARKFWAGEGSIGITL